MDDFEKTKKQQFLHVRHISKNKKIKSLQNMQVGNENCKAIYQMYWGINEEMI